MTESQIPRQILRIVELIKKHPGVEDARMLHDQSTADWTSVAVDVTVELPSRSMAHGESPNGVRSVETAFFRFRTGDLVRAPTIALREDLDRSLAHIIPGFPTGQVIPCVFDGDLSELLQRGGIWAIIDHLLDWLDKAATDDLIDRNQGWEPIRRDELRDALVARASDLQQYGEEDGPPFRALYSTRFFLYPISDGASAHNLAFYGTLVDRHKVADTSTCRTRLRIRRSCGLHRNDTDAQAALNPRSDCLQPGWSTRLTSPIYPSWSYSARTGPFESSVRPRALSWFLISPRCERLSIS